MTSSALASKPAPRVSSQASRRPRSALAAPPSPYRHRCPSARSQVPLSSSPRRWAAQAAAQVPRTRPSAPPSAPQLTRPRPLGPCRAPPSWPSRCPRLRQPPPTMPPLRPPTVVAPRAPLSAASAPGPAQATRKPAAPPPLACPAPSCSRNNPTRAH